MLVVLVIGLSCQLLAYGIRRWFPYYPQGPITMTVGYSECMACDECVNAASDEGDRNG